MRHLDHATRHNTSVVAFTAATTPTTPIDPPTRMEIKTPQPPLRLANLQRDTTALATTSGGIQP